MSSKQKAKILIIDDDANMVGALAMRLEGEGYECETATSRRQGLVRFHRRRFDLVITDMIMPKPDGFSLVDMIREVGTVPMIVVTGFARNRPPFLAEFSDVAFLAKPFEWQRLSELVARAVQKRSSKAA